MVKTFVGLCQQCQGSPIFRNALIFLFAFPILKGQAFQQECILLGKLIP